MRIYATTQTCARWRVTEDEEYRDHGDYVEAYSGTREEIIAEARRDLATTRDTRPGGAGDAYRHKIARLTLDALGAGR